MGAWEDLHKPGAIYPPNSDRCSFSVEVAFPMAMVFLHNVVGGVKSVMISPKIAAMKDMLIIFISINGTPFPFVTKHNSPQATKARYDVLFMKKYAMLWKNYNRSFLIYIDKAEKYVWEWILRVWVNSGRNIQLNQAEVFDMGSLHRNSAFNVAAV